MRLEHAAFALLALYQGRFGHKMRRNDGYFARGSVQSAQKSARVRSKGSAKGQGQREHFGSFTFVNFDV